VERHVKERLVGAAVLMAAAIILIPEMLSGPGRDANKPVAARAADEPAVKTYTIDLNRPPGSQTDAPVSIPEAAPPPETVAPAVAEPASAAAETVAREATIREPVTAKPETPPAAPVRSEAPVVRAEAPRPAQRTEAAPRTATSASAPASTSTPAKTAATPASQPATSASSTVPTAKGWAVQIGSFSSRATADRIAAELKAQRYAAFVMPVKTQNSTLYRVRIGPTAERTAADDVLKRVKAKYSGATVVSHP
jgi:DedD protein